MRWVSPAVPRSSLHKRPLSEFPSQKEESFPLFSGLSLLLPDIFPTPFPSFHRQQNILLLLFPLPAALCRIRLFSHFRTVLRNSAAFPDTAFSPVSEISSHFPAKNRRSCHCHSLYLCSRLRRFPRFPVRQKRPAPDCSEQPQTLRAQEPETLRKAPGNLPIPFPLLLTLAFFSSLCSLSL